MKKTSECINKIDVLFEALFAGDKNSLTNIAKEISKLEHECDIIKSDIRNHMSASVFLPIDRRDILHVVSTMDAIADAAEDIAVLLSLRWMELPKQIIGDFLNLWSKSKHTFELSKKVLDDLDLLLETGFSGPDSKKIFAKIEAVSKQEHEADKAQDIFGKALFKHEDDIKPAALLMWIKISGKVGDVANTAEKMTEYIRIMLARS